MASREEPWELTQTSVADESFANGDNNGKPKRKIPLWVKIAAGVAGAVIILVVVIVFVLGSATDMKEVKFGGDTIPTLLAATGDVRKVSSYATKAENGISTKTIAYSDNIPESVVADYMQFLINDGFIVTESRISEFQLGKPSVDAGKILLVDVRYEFSKMEVIYKKGEGTLTYFDTNPQTDPDIDSGTDPNTDTPPEISDSPAPGTQEPPVIPAGDILQDFNKITKNMTLEEVTRLIGNAGEEIYTNAFEWAYPNGYTLYISWFDDEIDCIEIEYEDDYSLLADDAVDFSEAATLYARIDEGESVSYDEFGSILGTPGILYEINYYDSGDVISYFWGNSEGDYIEADFEDGYCRYAYFYVR